MFYTCYVRKRDIVHNANEITVTLQCLDVTYMVSAYEISQCTYTRIKGEPYKDVMAQYCYLGSIDVKL